MDNHEYLKLLKKGVRDWNKFRDKNPYIKVDLCGVNLRRMDLRGANLRGADLRGANLRRANLRRAYLRGADLSRADLRGADLREANLREANLREANLREANLREANLFKANLFKANLFKANLFKANLFKANLFKANLREANLYEANLHEANLHEANLRETVELEAPTRNRRRSVGREQRKKLRAKLKCSKSMPIEEMCNSIETMCEGEVIIKKDGDEKKEIIPKKMKFLLSIAHPSHLSKRHNSRIIVNIYIPKARNKVKSLIEKQLGKYLKEQQAGRTILEMGQRIIITLYCPDIKFSDPVIKIIEGEQIPIFFIAKPNDDCYHGKHVIKLSVLDAKTENEIYATTFAVKVNDFIFDHISQPAFSKISTLFFGFGSFIIFMLTMLKQVDIAFGITSGSTAGLIATAIYGRFFYLFQRPQNKYREF